MSPRNLQFGGSQFCPRLLERPVDNPGSDNWYGYQTFGSSTTSWFVYQVYQVSSSEMFGDVFISPQDEETPFRPKNPYAAAKMHAHWTMVHHRQRLSDWIGRIM